MRGLAALALLAGALLGCSDDDDGETLWWESLLVYVPAEQSRGGLDLINVREAFGRLDIDGPDGRTCTEKLEEAREDTSIDGSESTWLDALNDLGVGVSGVAGFPAEAQGFVGFDSCQIDQLAWAGAEGNSIGVFVPSIDIAQVAQVLAERGYETSEHAGTGYLALGDDHEEIDPFTLGGQNRVLVEGEIVVRAPSHGIMHAAIDARASVGGSRDAEIYDMAKALGEFQAVTFVPRELVSRTLDEQVDVILGAVASGDPEEYERLKSRVIAEILDPYQDWHRLPPFERIGFAYQRTDSGTNGLKIVLAFVSSADAAAAAVELELRLASYDLLLSGEPMCGRVNVKAHRGEESSILVASCTVERPGDWIQIMLHDTLFLVEELPESE